MIATQTIELLAVLELQACGSFTQAARKLSLTPSALSKAIERLERRLGARLFERSTRSVTPTAEGERFAEFARRAVDELAAAEDEISQGRITPRGTLRINVGTAFANHQLLPALPRFMACYPELDIDLTVTDRLVDVTHDGYDLVIRTGPISPQLDAIAQPIAQQQRIVCAAPSYLARHGTPTHPDQLSAHQCLTVGGLGFNEWPFFIQGKVQAIHVKARIQVDNAESVLALGIAGAGILRQSDFMLVATLRAGRLQAILTDFAAPDTLPLTALYPRNRRQQAKLRAMLAFLDAEFGQGANQPDLAIDTLTPPSTPRRNQSTTPRSRA